MQEQNLTNPKLSISTEAEEKTNAIQVSIMQNRLSDLEKIEKKRQLTAKEIRERDDLKVNIQKMISKNEKRTNLPINSSISPQPTNEWIPQNTTPDGDCAFHAIFGQLNSNRYHCADVAAKRDDLRKRVASSEAGSTIHTLAIEGITNLIEGNINRELHYDIDDKHIHLISLRDRQKNFKSNEGKKVAELKNQLADTIEQAPNVYSYINANHQHSKGQSASLYEKYQNVLNSDDKNMELELLNRIRAYPALEKAKQDLDNFTNSVFVWSDYVSHDVINDYANFIGTAGQWLAQQEVALIAEIFGIGIAFYTKGNNKNDKYVYVETYEKKPSNQKQSQIIFVGYNGEGHFERLVKSTKKSESEKFYTPSFEQTISKSRIATSPASAFSINDDSQTLDFEGATSLKKEQASSAASDISDNPHSSNVEPQKAIPTAQLSNTSSSHTNTPHSSRSVRYPSLQKALRDTYCEYDKVRLPLDDRELLIQAVSLTINIKEDQQMRDHELIQLKEEKDEQNRDSAGKSATASRRMPPEFGLRQLEREAAWHKVEKPVSVADIFKPTSLKNDQPSKPIRRVLIEGRAGVGKTTLVRFIAWQWATQGLFAEQYDYVLWIPLRQWLNGQIISTTFKENLADFLLDYYLPSEATIEHLKELEEILGEFSEHTLLILDGYDEVAHHLEKRGNSKQPTIYNQLLRQALQFKNLLVTTRDYQLPPSHIRLNNDKQININFDQKLVNIGFTDTQIEQYLQKYCELSKNKSAFNLPFYEALRDNPQLWAMAHIPLSLALLCQTYDNRSLDKTKTVDLNRISLTHLYQNVLENFLEQQAKKDGRKFPEVYYLSTLTRWFIVEWDILSTLAWEGFQQGKVVLLPEKQKSVFETLKSQNYKDLEEFERYIDRALTLGLLRSEDPNSPRGRNQPRYFIHRTFHEYFAAQYLADNLQGYRSKVAYEQALRWIKQNKYDPYAAVVVSFIAGITVQKAYKRAMSAFWYAILSPPYELIPNLAHQRLILRCLEETDCDVCIPGRDQLMTEIAQWVKWSLTSHRYSLSINSTLLASPHNQVAQSIVIPELLQALKEKEEDTRVAAVRALRWMGKKLTNHPNLIKALLQMLEDQSANVREAAAGTLGYMEEQLTDQSHVVDVLLQVAQNDQGDYVRGVAVHALVRMGEKLAGQTHVIEFLLQRLEDADEHQSVQTAIVEVLGKMGEKLADQPYAVHVMEVLLQVLKNKDPWIRTTAVKVLGEMGGKLTDQSHVVDTLLQMLKDADENKDVQQTIVKVLGKMGEKLAGQTHVVHVMEVLLRTLKDQGWDVRQAAAKVVKGTPKFLEEDARIFYLKQILEDKNTPVRDAIIETLCQISRQLTSQPQVIDALLQALKDENPWIRKAAVKVLGQMAEKLAGQPKAVGALLQALGDQESDIKFAAGSALRRMNVALANYPETVELLLQALNDQNNYVRGVAVEVLGQMGTALENYPEAVKALLWAMEDQDSDIRRYAIKTLGQMGAKLANQSQVIKALLRALNDQNNYVQQVAVEALGQMGEKLADQHHVVEALIQALQNYNIREAVAKVLGQMSTVLVNHPKTENLFLQALEKDFNLECTIIKNLGQIGEKLANYPQVKTDLATFFWTH